ncbi:Similar to transporters, possibly for inorganic phosphate [Ectocarpus siliculosus]|uniref:Similar to transporters, possibly for inorganic phosphate n=1 Tax=Ectocarpus siliculosus TaxID=2880 RepID=D8LQQ2_ECTSI|nr:Similar to transporters, possibly for inorganic phosphate [Ectocarpus siliculosus]|eukprot:CBN74929.1 Similar to transporters, possibly for inorganic phosphate [Ectocarpus siliculosus]
MASIMHGICLGRHHRRLLAARRGRLRGTCQHWTLRNGPHHLRCCAVQQPAARLARFPASKEVWVPQQYQEAQAGVVAAIALDDVVSGGEPVTSAVAAAAAAAGAGVSADVGSEAAGSINQQLLLRDRDVILADKGSASTADATGEGSDSSSRNPGSLFVIMGLCFLVAVVCALDRVAMSVAIVPMGNVYDYSETTKGLISSVFSWGYMASMVPSSVLIGVWGPKATITAGVLVWSAAQMLSPTAAGVSLETLLACRFLMGVGEAVTMPSIQAIVAERVPQDQRSRWLALIISGLQIGTVLAYWGSPVIVDTWDWQTMFLAYGALGLAWIALWLPLVSDKPRSPASAADAAETPDASATTASAGRIRPGRDAGGGVVSSATPSPQAALAGAGEKAAVGVGSANGGSGGALPVETVALEGEEGGGAAAGEGGGGVLEGFRAVPWKEYVTNGQIWSIAAAHMAHNWGLYVLLAWLPTYFVQEFNLTLEQSSGASVLPWVVGAVAGNMAGSGADLLVKKGMLEVKWVRKLFQTVALVGPAACMLLLAQGPETSAEASKLFTAAVALGSCSCAGFGSSVQDLRSRDTGVIYGMTSAASAVCGSVGTYGAGIILDTTDSWTMVFQSCAAVYLVGAGVYAAFYRAEPLEVEGRGALVL